MHVTPKMLCEPVDCDLTLFNWCICPVFNCSSLSQSLYTVLSLVTVRLKYHSNLSMVHCMCLCGVTSWQGQPWQPALSICSIKKRKRTSVHYDLALEHLCGLINWRDQVGGQCRNSACLSLCDCLLCVKCNICLHLYKMNIFMFLRDRCWVWRMQLPGFGCKLHIACCDNALLRMMRMC